MKHPQTLATRLYEHFPDETLGKIKSKACCAFVLLWCLGIEPDEDADAITMIDDLLKKKALKPDCTVLWESAIKALTGRTLKSIDFVKIKTIGNIKERTPVRYDYNGSSHWVGVENGIIAFNPLSFSVCVECGRPAEKRVLHIEGVNL